MVMFDGNAAGACVLLSHMFALPRTASAVKRDWWWSECEWKELAAPAEGMANKSNGNGFSLGFSLVVVCSLR